MKTLVIHPKDISTDFLCEIYKDTDWTVLRSNLPKKQLKKEILCHDRVIMLGHGCDDGLIGYDHLIIDSKYVYLLREKTCVCIWCNADKFVEKYKLSGFFTGMIISESQEAYMYALMHTYSHITESNKSFATAVRHSLNSENIVESIRDEYLPINNPIIYFNRNNLYTR